MGIFYDAIIKMRENGRSLYKEEKPKEVKKPVIAEKPPTTNKKPTEMAVKKNDKPAGGKS